MMTVERYLQLEAEARAIIIANGGGPESPNYFQDMICWMEELVKTTGEVLPWGNPEPEGSQ